MSLQYGLYPQPGVNIPEAYCNEPTNLRFEVNGDIVTLIWDKPHDVAYFDITIFEVLGAPQFVRVTGQRTVIRLKPNTTFNWFIKSVCSALPLRESALVSGPQFITGNHTIECLPADITQVLETSGTDFVQLTWPANSDANAFKVYYKVRNTIMPYDVVAVQTNTVKLTAVAPNTIYDYYITTICKDGKVVDSEVGQFKTALDPSICPPPEVTAVVNGTSAVIVWKYTGLYESCDIFINGQLFLAAYPANLINLSNLNATTSYIVTVVGRCADGNSIAGSTQFTTSAVACGKVSNLTYVINGNQATVSWPAVAGSTGYNVIVNGVKLSTTDPTLTFAITNGGTFNVDVTSLCASGESLPEHLSFVAPFTCPAYIAAEISTTRVYENGVFKITYDWPDKSGIVAFRYRRKLVDDNGVQGAWGEWVPTTNSEVVIYNRFYSDFELEYTCTTGAIASVVLPAAATPVLIGGKPVITSFTDVTEKSFCVNFTLPDGKDSGTFVAKVFDTNTAITKEYPGNTLKICITDATPHTAYNVTIEDREPGFTIVPSDPASVTTCYACGDPLATASFLPNGDIKVDWTDLPTIPSYRITATEYSPDGGIHAQSQVVVNAGNQTYTFTGKNFAFSSILIEYTYPDCNRNCSVTIAPACPKVTGLIAEITGTLGTLKWTPVLNALGYKVRVISLTYGIQEFFTEDAFYNIADLGVNVDYSYTVEAYCTATNISPVSDPVAFRTSYETTPGTNCPEPVFSAIQQDSALSDPAAGGGTTVDNSAPATINYTTLYGDAFDRSMILKDGAGVPLNLTGYDFNLDLKDGTTLVETWTKTGGSIIVVAADGKVTYNRTNVQMSALTKGKLYTYALKWTTPSAVTKTIIVGSISIE